MSDYTKLPRDIAECMRRAGSPLSEDQRLLLAGYLAPVQQKLADSEARVAELQSFAVKNMAGLIAFARESGVDVEEQNSEYMRVVAQRPRQQADEAERAGGEK